MMWEPTIGARGRALDTGGIMRARKVLSALLAVVMLGALMPASAIARARSESSYYGSQQKRTHMSIDQAAELRAQRATAKRSASGISASSLRKIAVTPDSFDLAPGGDDTTTTATPVNWGVEETHSIDATSGHTLDWTNDGPDWDYHVFTATAGTLYTFDTTGTADTLFELVDYDNGDPLYVWNDDRNAEAGDFGSHITWTAPEAADGHKYYIITEPANFVGGVGDYTFTATQQSSTYVPGVVVRLWGGDRYGTAYVSAKTAFPGMTYLDRTTLTRKHVTTVLIANGDDAKAADPLAAASLAGVYHAPLMLVSARKIPPSTASVINSIKAGNGGKVNIIVIGGTGTVPLAIYNGLAKLKGAGTITRVSGLNRYDLAGKIADRVRSYWLNTYHHEPPYAFVSNGENPAAFWDALSASPAMYRTRGPLLLTKNASVPAETHNRIAAHWSTGSTLVFVLNEAYCSSSLQTHLGTAYLRTWTGGPDGRDRSWAAYDITEMSKYWWFVPSEKIAVTNKLADSLTGGIAMGEMGGGLLYANKTVATGVSNLGVAPWWDLWWNQSVIANAYVLGGSGSVGANPYAEITGLVQ